MYNLHISGDYCYLLALSGININEVIFMPVKMREYPIIVGKDAERFLKREKENEQKAKKKLKKKLKCNQ